MTANFRTFRPLVAVAAILVLTMLVAADTPSAPFKHPKAVTAWNRYQYRATKAREAYEREMVAARTEYKAALNEAAQVVAKSGDAEELKRIVEAQESVASESQKEPQDTPPAKKWIRLSRRAGDTPLFYTFEAGGDLSANGPTTWRSWSTSSGGMVIINGNPMYRFRVVNTPVLVGVSDEVKHLVFLPDEVGD